jgi:hypothetical protein
MRYLFRFYATRNFLPFSVPVHHPAEGHYVTKLDVASLSNLSAGLAMSIEKELAGSYSVQNIRPHAIRSQSEARDLLVGKRAQGDPFVFPNDTRIAQDRLFRVTYPTRSNREESGISFPLRQA